MRKLGLFVLILPLLIGGLIPNAVHASPDTATFWAVDDSHVSFVTPDTNYGGWAYIHIRNGWEPMYGLVRFDTSPIPSGSIITSATLKLFFEGIWGGGTMDAHRITAPNVPWSEGTVNWNNQPGHEGTATASATMDFGWVTWDVTADVQAFVSGTANYGWKLITGGNVAVRSKENTGTTYDPVLEVFWEPPPSGIPEFGFSVTMITSLVAALYLVLRKRYTK